MVFLMKIANRSCLGKSAFCSRLERLYAMFYLPDKNVMLVLSYI